LVYVLPLSRKEGGNLAALPELPNASILNWRESAQFNAEVPLEFQGPSLLTMNDDPEGLAASATFQGMAEQKWATQDFLPPTNEEADLYPSQLEMKALRFGGLSLRIGAAALAVFVGLTGVRVCKILNDEVWHYEPSISREHNQILTSQIRRYEQWNSFLADRSKAWVSMELVNQLFPNPDRVVLSDIRHTVRPEVARDQSKASLVKEWTISGLVDDENLERLTELNTAEGISGEFDAVYQLTGDESFRTDLESRSLEVNLLASENRRYDPKRGGKPEDNFPFMFNLTITQQISNEDPIAIPTVAAQ
jgi:hypothetical protein